LKHEFKHRVIYQDTDAEGVVYYANYLGYFERGRTELLRQLGIHLKDLKEKHNIIFAVTRVECDYRSPARYEDDLTITTRIEEISAATIVFKQEVLRGDQVLVSARITGCAVGTKNLRPVRLPESLRQLAAQ
jgi:acyl-CoA thioester hydrolase